MSRQPLNIEVNREPFLVIFESEQDSSLRYHGNAYPITHWERPWTNESGWAYTSKTGGHNHDAVNEDCRIMFEFSFCWRGVWEGRLYFKDSEYWAEELETMHLLWQEIQSALKAEIQHNHPNKVFED